MRLALEGGFAAEPGRVGRWPERAVGIYPMSEVQPVEYTPRTLPPLLTDPVDRRASARALPDAPPPHARGLIGGLPVRVGEPIPVHRPDTSSCRQALTAASRTAATEPSLPLKRILVVDDDPSLCDQVAAMLQARGFEVLTATDGATALAFIRREPPDLVLSDVDMPGLDGLELLSAVRLEPATELLPFVLMAQRPELAGMRHGMNRGADNYLPKPFRAAELVAVIGRCLHRQHVLHERAEQRLGELRRDVLGMLPHEFLTPLDGILGVAELLELGGGSAADLADYAGMLRTSGERLHRLASNFLLCADLELAAGDPARLALFRGGATSSAAPELIAALKKRALNWDRAADLDLQIAPLDLPVSSRNLAKILDELLDNAFKFSAPGSPVSLTCDRHAGRACWRVHDRGRGISAGAIGRLAEFVQLDRKLHEQQGAGLGVAIARRLAELHGGSLTLQSPSDAGTIVVLELPLTTPL